MPFPIARHAVSTTRSVAKLPQPAVRGRRPSSAAYISLAIGPATYLAARLRADLRDEEFARDRPADVGDDSDAQADPRLFGRCALVTAASVPTTPVSPQRPAAARHMTRGKANLELPWVPRDLPLNGGCTCYVTIHRRTTRVWPPAVSSDKLDSADPGRAGTLLLTVRRRPTSRTSM